MGNNSSIKTGILLLNLGGPDSLEAVRPFLYNLFSDRDIIRLGPQFMQKPLAYLISTLRHRKTESFYSLIGGKSPILDITAAQAKALEEALTQEPSDGEYRVFIGMRYWSPFTEDVVPQMHGLGIKRIIALSLYPHYSIATTGSSLAKLKEVVTRYPMDVFSISSWYDHPLYIDALVEKIRKGISSFGAGEGQGVHLLFSAHSLPIKFIEEGDPYAEHIRQTIHAVTGALEIPWDLSYQSKSGPVKWLEPSTEEMIGDLAARGVKNVLVVPISFVSDHIETLYEIDILYKNMAEGFGMKMERVESLNVSPLFISALKDIVMKGIKEAGWGE